MAKPKVIDDLTNCDFGMLKKLNLTSPFKKITFYCTLNNFNPLVLPNKMK